MYKVLIVDDEKYVISLIEKLVDWEKLGMEVVGSAGDGIQGIRMVEELKPDILIADVKMPGFDGISLIKKVREIDRDVKFIMISGHKRFEYAKSVMKYNVEDYLLKPIDKQELEDILEKIRGELDQRAARRETESERNKRWDANRSLMNGLFMEKLCSGEIFEGRTDLGNVNDMFFTEFTENRYQCVIVQLNGITGSVGDSFVEDFLLSVCKRVREILQEACVQVLDYIEHHRILFLLIFEQEGEQNLKSCIRQAFSAGDDMLSRYTGLKLAFGVGEAVHLDTDIDLLKHGMETAERAVDIRFRDGYDRVLFCTLADSAGIGADTERRLEELGKDIRSASKTVIGRSVETIYASARKELYQDPFLYTRIAWRINQELYQYLRLFRETDDLQQELRRKMKFRLQEASGERELVQGITRHICESIESVVGDSKSSLSLAIRTAKIYIIGNYMRDISLNDVANVVSLSPVYFSGLFKKEIGENFIDYLNRVRIDAAKNMLKDVPYHISEVAENCGFSDTRYFARIFKRIVGITPSDYRKRQLD